MFQRHPQLGKKNHHIEGKPVEQQNASITSQNIHSIAWMLQGVTPGEIDRKEEANARRIQIAELNSCDGDGVVATRHNVTRAQTGTVTESNCHAKRDK